MLWIFVNGHSGLSRIVRRKVRSMVDKRSRFFLGLLPCLVIGGLDILTIRLKVNISKVASMNPEFISWRESQIKKKRNNYFIELIYCMWWKLYTCHILKEKSLNPSIFLPGQAQVKWNRSFKIITLWSRSSVCTIATFTAWTVGCSTASTCTPLASIFEEASVAETRKRMISGFIIC